jgi:type VI secretion system protein ImpA
MSASPEVIDIEALLSPIAGENPAGESLQYDPIYDQIKEARRAEDPLSQGDWQRELKVADWDEVIRLSTEALGQRTKDLQICAWLTEGLARSFGFRGLRDGLKLAAGLHERYWDTLYPEVEEGDLEARANALALLDRQAASAIKEAPVTRAPAFSFLQWEIVKGEGAAAPAEAPASAEGEPAVTLDSFQKARNASRRAFYEELWSLVGECWAAFQALDRVMDEKFARQTPGLGELKMALEKIRDWTDKTVKEKRLEEPDGSTIGGEAGESGGAGGGAVAGAVSGRQDALRRLADVAEYFRRTEPHSPVSYLVQRAIAWGQMPLDAWLGDVIKDGVLLENLKETLGIKSSSSGEG